MTKALYRYPAEWEEQEATWLAFPHNKQNWHGERGVKIRKFYVELIRTISEFQPVNVLVPNKKFLTLDEKFAVADRPFPASFIICKTDDIWIRDYGPFFVKKGSPLCYNRQLSGEASYPMRHCRKQWASRWLSCPS